MRIGVMLCVGFLSTATWAQGSATPADKLLESAAYWGTHQRDDLARQALDKLLDSDPQHAQGLVMLGQLEMRSARPAACADVVARLRAAHSGAASTAQLVLECRIATTDRIAMARVRHLAESGEASAAAHAVHSLFRGTGGVSTDRPTIVLSGELGLEYLQILSGEPAYRAVVISSLERLSQDYPADPRYALLLADQLLERPGNGEYAWRVLSTQAEASEAQRERALSHWRRDVDAQTDPKRRKLAAQRYLRADPKNAKVNAWLAQAKRPSGTDTSGSAAPARTDYRDLARMADDNGDVLTASEWLRLGSKLSPDDPWIRFDLAKWWIQSSYPNRARELAATGVQDYPNSDEMRFAAGLIYEKLDDYRAAAQTLESIVPQRRTTGIVELMHRAQVADCFDRGEAAVDQDRPVQVVAVLDECESLIVDDAGLLRRVVSAWVRAGYPELALSALEKYQPLHTNPALEVWLATADQLEQRGQYETFSQVAMRLRSVGQMSPQEAQQLADLEQRRVLAQRVDIETPASSSSSREPYWVASAGIDGISKPGAEGRSKLKRTSVPMQLQYHTATASQWSLLLDVVRLDAGDLPADYDEAAFYGQVAAAGPSAIEGFPDGVAQSAQGVAVGVAYSTSGWDFDAGVTPLGFDVVDWVGGVSYSGAWGETGYSLELSRRPITSTLLSYAGATDPVSGTVWGGMRETGLRARASRSWGAWDGFVSAAAMHQSGRRVADNRFFELRTGADYAVIQRENQQLYLGLTATYWKHQKNLRYYSFGHGGYYSPQRRLAFSLPLDFRHQSGAWSWQLRASLSFSDVFEDDAPFFPNDPDLQSAAAQNEQPSGYADAIYDDGGDGGGSGHSLLAAVEYAMTTSWVVGARFEVDRSAFYEPNFFGLYLRHRFGGEERLRRPPQSPKPYANY